MSYQTNTAVASCPVAALDAAAIIAFEQSHATDDSTSARHLESEGWQLLDASLHLVPRSVAGARSHICGLERRLNEMLVDADTLDETEIKDGLRNVLGIVARLDEFLATLDRD